MELPNPDMQEVGLRSCRTMGSVGSNSGGEGLSVESVACARNILDECRRVVSGLNLTPKTGNKASYQIPVTPITVIPNAAGD